MSVPVRESWLAVTVLTLSGKTKCDAEECMNSTNESLVNVLFHSSSWHFALSSLLNVHLVLTAKKIKNEAMDVAAASTRESGFMMCGISL